MEACKNFVVLECRRNNKRYYEVVWAVGNASRNEKCVANAIVRIEDSGDTVEYCVRHNRKQVNYKRLDAQLRELGSTAFFNH